MQTITFEVNNPQDYTFLLDFAKRMGLKFKTSKNVKIKDETDYLLSTEANKKHLLEAVEYVENNGKRIEFDLEQMKHNFLK